MTNIETTPAKRRAIVVWLGYFMGIAKQSGSLTLPDKPLDGDRIKVSLHGLDITFMITETTGVSWNIEDPYSMSHLSELALGGWDYRRGFAPFNKNGKEERDEYETLTSPEIHRPEGWYRIVLRRTKNHGNDAYHISTVADSRRDIPEPLQPLAGARRI